MKELLLRFEVLGVMILRGSFQLFKIVHKQRDRLLPADASGKVMKRSFRKALFSSNPPYAELAARTAR